MCHQDVACAPDPKEGKIWESKDVKQEVFFGENWWISLGWGFPPTHQKRTNQHEPFFCREISFCSRPAARWGVLKKSYGSYKEGKNLQTLIIILLHRKVWASHTTPPLSQWDSELHRNRRLFWLGLDSTDGTKMCNTYHKFFSFVSSAQQFFSAF